MIDVSLMAARARPVDDAQIHRIHESRPGQVAILGRHAFGLDPASLLGPGNVCLQLQLGLAITPVAVHTAQLSLGVHVFDASMTIHATL